MGPVSASVIARVKRQVDEQQLVVWFDPERHYESILPPLEQEGIPVEVFDGSIFALRHRVERFLSAAERPRLVVYVPGDEDRLRWPLGELTAAGVVMRPGQQPVQRNTRLAVVARAALAERIGPESLEAVIKQVEAGSLSLAELDALSERGAASTGVLAVIFDTSDAGEIALRFLSDERVDGKLAERKAEGDLRSLLDVAYAFSTRHASLSDVRRAFARYLLGLELREACGEYLPDSLRELPQPVTRAHREAALALVRTWRNRRDLQTSYIDLTDQAEEALGLDDVSFAFDALCRMTGFRGVEERLQSKVEQALIDHASRELLDIVDARQRGFWASVDAELLGRWALDGAIARLLLAAQSVEKTAKSQKCDATTLVRCYVEGVEGVEPWCVLDTLHRQMEQRVHRFDMDLTGTHDALEQLIARARQRYADAATLVAERFVASLEQGGLFVPGYGIQRKVYQSSVAPAIGDSKIAYVLVDALRYEMARELHGERDQAVEGELFAVIGTLPSITEVGMAAVLPGAEDGLALEALGAGRLGVRLRGTLLRNRKERLDHLTACAGVATYVGRLSDILPPSKKTKESIEAARLVVLTATDELDGLCESGNVPMARRLMEDVLAQIRRGLRYLFELGVKTAIVTSDHGFVFGETLDTATTIDAPGGQTVDLHRRVWVGRGGTSSPAVARLKAEALGLGGDLEVAVPRALAGFKVAGGNVAYFHGGASPAELVLPVWVVRSLKAAKASLTPVAWTLTPGSRTVSTRFLSVQISGQVSGLFSEVPPTVRVEVRSGKAPLSRAVASSYGFQEATGFVALAWSDDERRTIRPNAVTLMLDVDNQIKQVTIVLLDAETDRVLATCDLPVSLAGF
jgi:hypothetical protein